MTWWVGVVLSTVGSVVLNIGHNVMKQAHERGAGLGSVGYLRERRWWCGFGLFVCGNGLDFVALSFAAQSVIAALGGVSLVSNAVLAPWFNGERMGAWDVGGTALVEIGRAHV